MQIEDEQIEASMAVLLDDAEARALYLKMMAEKNAKEVWAAALLRATGNNEERKAKATIDPEYSKAVEEVAIAAGKHRKTQNDREGAKYIIQVWEQNGHNVRALDRVR